MANIKEVVQRLLIEIEKGQGSPHDLVAKFLMRRFCFKTLRDTGEVLVYSDGIYISAESMIREYSEAIMQKLDQGGKATTRCVNEVIGHIQRSTYVNRRDFDSNPDLMNVSNGILNLRTRKLVPHTKGFLSRLRIPVTYNAEAECPAIKRFLIQIVKEEDIEVLEEIFGWCLDKQLSKAMSRLVFLEGETHTGKSTYLALLRTFLGPENCASIAIHSLANEQFAKANLYGKMANICSELERRDLKELSLVKALVKNVIQISRSGLQTPVYLCSYVKHVIQIAVDILPVGRQR